MWLPAGEGGRLSFLRALSKFWGQGPQPIYFPKGTTSWSSDLATLRSPSFSTWASSGSIAGWP